MQDSASARNAMISTQYQHDYAEELHEAREHLFMEGLYNCTMAREWSMELQNDPRFFTGNVIMQRLAAFTMLSTLSGIFLSFGSADVMDANKEMRTRDIHGNIDPLGVLQLCRYTLNVGIFFVNIMGVYIGVVQPYHVYRLMTCGPSGFDAAATYYLNKNVTLWRHFATKGMMLSLGWYTVAVACAAMVQFFRNNENDESDMPTKVEATESQIQSYVFASIAIFLSALMVCIHSSHRGVFNEVYMAATDQDGPMQSAVYESIHGRGDSTFMDV
jgi:hypothetical protein